MLHAVAELAEHLVRDVARVLRDEVHADALGADQPGDLLDLEEQRVRDVVEEQVGLVEEEHELRLRQVAGLRQALEQLAQHPQQRRGIDLRRAHQPVRGEDVHDPAAFRVGLHQVVQVERRFAEELVAALGFQREQVALDGPDAGGGDVAVPAPEGRGVLADMAQHRAQVLEVEQEQSVLVGDAEDQVQHAFLHLVQPEQPRQQQRPHLRHRGAHRMALLAEDVPEGDRAGEGPVVLDTEQLRPFEGLRRLAAGHAKSGEVAFHVGEEHRDSLGAEAFGETLERDGLAGAGGTGDESVPVGHRRQQAKFGGLVLGDEDGRRHGRKRRCGARCVAAGQVAGRQGKCKPGFGRRMPGDGRRTSSAEHRPSGTWLGIWDPKSGISSPTTLGRGKFMFVNFLRNQPRRLVSSLTAAGLPATS